jgi:hypothetical protein
MANTFSLARTLMLGLVSGMYSFRLRRTLSGSRFADDTLVTLETNVFGLCLVTPVFSGPFDLVSCFSCSLHLLISVSVEVVGLQVSLRLHGSKSVCTASTAAAAHNKSMLSLLLEDGCKCVSSVL